MSVLLEIMQLVQNTSSTNQTCFFTLDTVLLMRYNQIRIPYANLKLLHHIYNFVPENNKLVINNARGADFAKIYRNALLGCMEMLTNIGSTFADDLRIDINKVFRIVNGEHRLGHGFLEPNVAVGGPARYSLQCIYGRRM